MEISIVHEPTKEQPFLIINKPKHLPSAPLTEGDESAYNYAQSIYPDLRNVSGKKSIEHGLIHRIDTETDGLLLIAATQDFYNWMQKVQDEGIFYKQYTAFCHLDVERNDDSFPNPPFWGIPYFKPVKISSLFRFYGPKNSLVRPVTNQCSKIILRKAGSVVYTTNIDSIEKDGGQLKVKCSINRGFKHQVRCHLAWCGLSIFGDDKYAAEWQSTDACELKFSATALTFPLENGEEYHVEI